MTRSVAELIYRLESYMGEEETETTGIVSLVIRALYRARISIFAVALVYSLSMIASIVKVSIGTGFAATGTHFFAGKGATIGQESRQPRLYRRRQTLALPAMVPITSD
jgi:hypothetical protein